MRIYFKGNLNELSGFLWAASLLGEDFMDDTRRKIRSFRLSGLFLLNRFLLDLPDHRIVFQALLLLLGAASDRLLRHCERRYSCVRCLRCGWRTRKLVFYGLLSSEIT